MYKLLDQLGARFQEIKGKALFQDSFWMILNRVISSVIQVIYFILLARMLGNEYYGLFEGTKSLWSMVFPFVGLGMGNVLIQNVTRDRGRFSQYWGDALLVSIVSIGIALVAVFPLAVLLLPASPPLFILLLFFGDLVGLKFCQLAGATYIANNQVKQGAKLDLLYTFCKLIAVFLLPLFPENNRLISWGILYCLGSILPAIVLLVLAQKRFGKPEFNIKSFKTNQLSQGFYFSLSDSASNINGQIDSTMLVSLSTPLAAGVYGAGVRFIGMAVLPILAIQTACYPRFFRHGEKGIRGSLIFVRQLFPFALFYGVVSLFALIAFSSWVPKILGDDFQEASSVLIWLSPVILAVSLQGLAADALTGAGFQRSRSIVQVAAAILNVALNLYLIPRYSWHGAIWATLSSEAFKLIALWSIVFVVLRKSKKAEH
jgi:O-antigen/teichoic acid export membrane protein